MQIQNSCSKKPKGLMWQVRRSLDWFDVEHLEGLEAILLIDHAPSLTDELPEWLGKHISEGVPIYGWYVPVQEGIQYPHITLCVQQIYHSVPSFLWWSTVPTLRIIRTLAHEVAHHLFRTRGFIDQIGEKKEDEELLAENYAIRTLQRAVRRLQYRLGDRLTKEIAFWHYSQGILDVKSGQYLSASKHFFKAWDLDPELQDVTSYYSQAKEMSLTKQ